MIARIKTGLSLRWRAPDSLLVNALHLLWVNLLPALLGAAFWMLAGHLYSPADIGLAAAVISAAALVAGIAGPGFNLGLIRFLPEARRPVSFLNTIYTVIAVLACGCGLVFMAGLEIWAPPLLGLRDSAWSVLAFIGFVVAVDLGAVVRDTFVARRQSQYALGYTLIANLGRLVFILGLARLGMFGVVIAVSAGYAAALAATWPALPRVVSGYTAYPSWDRAAIRSIIPFSFGNYLVNFTGQVNQTVMPLMISSVLGATANGYAYMPLMLSALLISPGLALSMSAFAEGANQEARSAAIISRAARFALPITAATAVITIAAAPWILRLFGATYSQQSVALLRWLSLASLPLVVNQLYYSWLRICKKTLLLVLLAGLTLAINLGGTYFSLPAAGIAAAGISALLANIAVLILALLEFTFSRGKAPAMRQAPPASLPIGYCPDENQ